jgi:hypothetical protein
MPVAGCVDRILRSSRARATPSAGGFAGCELRGGFGNDRLEIAGRGDRVNRASCVFSRARAELARALEGTDRQARAPAAATGSLRIDGAIARATTKNKAIAERRLSSRHFVRVSIQRTTTRRHWDCKKTPRLRSQRMYRMPTSADLLTYSRSNLCLLRRARVFAHKPIQLVPNRRGRVVQEQWHRNALAIR